MKKLIILSLFFLSFSSQANFKAEESATINVVGGNTKLKAYSFKSVNTYEKGAHSYGLNGNYSYGETDEVRTIENWSAGLKYGHKLSEKQSLFLGELVEANRFTGISRRYNSDFGHKFQFIKSDKLSLFSEVGYRYTIEQNVDELIEEKKDSKARVYIEGKKFINKNVNGKLWVEFLPNFSDSEDYLLNVEPSVTVLLTSNFSMKTAYLWKYDGAPIPGNMKHDYNYTLSLIANF